MINHVITLEDNLFEGSKVYFNEFKSGKEKRRERRAKQRKKLPK